MHNRPRRFRHRPNGRGHQRDNGGETTRLGSSSISSIRPRNNFKNYQSAEKLIEKYNTLAKEALTSGDKILSENYFQHADHFVRMIGDKNRSQNQSKVQVNDKPVVNDKNLSENSAVNHEKTIKEKKE